jgi:hypothetical protein
MIASENPQNWAVLTVGVQRWRRLVVVVMAVKVVMMVNMAPRCADPTTSTSKAEGNPKHNNWCGAIEITDA